MKVTRYDDLEIWKEGMSIVKEIYLLIQKGKFRLDFELKQQIVRAAISVPSNIAEGFERNTRLEFKRFLLISKGSLGELRTQFIIARELGYVSTEDFSDLDIRLVSLSFKIGSLIRYLRNNKYQKTS